MSLQLTSSLIEEAATRISKVAHKTALDYLLKSLVMKQRIYRNEDHHNIVQSLKNIGISYTNLNDHKSALKYHKKSLEMMERIYKNGEANLSDILLSILEQQKVGIFHRDININNLIFNGLIAVLIDYDQAVRNKDLKKLSTYESIKFFTEQQNEYIDILDRNTKRLKTLIEDLFEVSKVNSGNIQLNPIDLDIHALLQQVLFEYQEQFEHHHLNLKNDYENSLKFSGNEYF